MNIFTTFWGRCFQQPKHRLKAQFVDEASAVELARQRKERLGVAQYNRKTDGIISSVLVDASQSPFPRGSGLSGSKPWAQIENPEDIRAFVADATEEELREMAALVLADSVLSPEWAEVRERIVLAVYAYEGSWRRLTSVVSEVRRPVRR
ncbi:MAG: hypothetical protein EpisKO_25340 [Epibacterium sp.]